MKLGKIKKMKKRVFELRKRLKKFTLKINTYSNYHS